VFTSPEFDGASAERKGVGGRGGVVGGGGDRGDGDAEIMTTRDFEDFVFLLVTFAAGEFAIGDPFQGLRDVSVSEANPFTHG